jgi:pimeloyl-ACP methyl ester carboxylesterase
VPSVGRLRYLEARPRGPSIRQRPRGTLVLLHAFPLSARLWEPQLALADAGWHVIAPDFRGFGDGAADPPADRLDDYVADLVDLLDTLHVHDAVIAGESMGGYVAFALLRIVPSYVRGLILADTRAEADSAEGVAGRRRMLALVAERGVQAVADEMVPKLLGETTRRERARVVDAVRSLILANTPQAIAGAVTAMMQRPDSTPLLATIHIPTLVVVGGEDALMPPGAAEALCRGIGGAELVTLAGAGHLPSVETPEAFNEVVARFLEHRV